MGLLLCHDYGQQKKVYVAYHRHLTSPAARLPLLTVLQVMAVFLELLRFAQPLYAWEWLISHFCLCCGHHFGCGHLRTHRSNSVRSPGQYSCTLHSSMPHSVASQLFPTNIQHFSCTARKITRK